MNSLPSVENDARMPHHRLSVRDAAVATLTSISVVALALIAWRLAPVLLMVFGGALVAIFLRALAEFTAKWTGLGYHWSLALVVVLLIACGVAGLLAGGQVIATQMTQLAEQIPKSAAKLREDIARYSWGEQLLEAAPTSVDELPIEQDKAASYATGAASAFSGGLAALLVVLFLAIYLAVDPARYVEGSVRLIPRKHRVRVREVLGEVHQTLRWWLLGKFVSMLIVGILTAIGLGLLGVPMATALGVIAALLTFVPNFGPIIAAVPAVMLGMVESPTTALYVAALYLAIQTIESYVITPMIQQRTVSLPPALTISSQIGMGIFFGIGGVVLATPIAAAVAVAISELYVKDALEKEA